MAQATGTQMTTGKNLGSPDATLTTNAAPSSLSGWASVAKHCPKCGGPLVCENVAECGYSSNDLVERSMAQTDEAIATARELLADNAALRARHDELSKALESVQVLVEELHTATCTNARGRDLNQLRRRDALQIITTALKMRS